jgi:hypothetical protein
MGIKDWIRGLREPEWGDPDDYEYVDDDGRTIYLDRNGKPIDDK